jgi:hypothetical protein
MAPGDKCTGPQISLSSDNIESSVFFVKQTLSKIYIENFSSKLTLFVPQVVENVTKYCKNKDQLIKKSQKCYLSTRKDAFNTKIDLSIMSGS